MQQYSADYWGRWAEHPDPAFVALDATGRKLGAVMVRPNATDEPGRGWLLFAIGVEAHARSQGVGQRLIERVIAFARIQEVEHVNLLVDPTNPRAFALYQRIGFVEVGEKDHAIEMQLHVR
jgi:ribosomal protein S18 acetylase RimI-like enzyme